MCIHVAIQRMATVFTKCISQAEAPLRVKCVSEWHLDQSSTVIYHVIVVEVKQTNKMAHTENFSQYPFHIYICLEPAMMSQLPALLSRVTCRRE